MLPPGFISSLFFSSTFPYLHTHTISTYSDINTWLLLGRSYLNQLLTRDQVTNQRKKYGEEIHACSEKKETQANKNVQMWRFPTQILRVCLEGHLLNVKCL